MDDREFIEYCATHSETERALFNGPQVARLIRLSGGDEATASVWESRGSGYWRSLDLSDLCGLARLKLWTDTPESNHVD